MIQLLNLGIKHLCIIYNGDLKIKIEKNNFCLFLTEWNSRHWGTIKADNWTKMCKTTLPIWYWTEKSGKWNTWKGLTACYIKADVGATPLEIVVAFHSMIFSQHFLFNTSRYTSLLAVHLKLFLFCVTSRLCWAVTLNLSVTVCQCIIVLHTVCSPTGRRAVHLLSIQCLMHKPTLCYK